MCARYVSAAPVEDLAKYFSATLPEHTLEANFNVAPTPASDLDFVSTLMVPAPQSLLAMHPVSTAETTVPS